VLSTQLCYCTAVILNWAYSGLLVLFSVLYLKIGKKKDRFSVLISYLFFFSDFLCVELNYFVDSRLCQQSGAVFLMDAKPV